MDQQPPIAQPPAPQPAQPSGQAWGQPPAPPAPQPPAPGWGAARPPQPASGWVMPAERRGPVTVASKLGALVLLVFGVLWTAIGALVMIIGGTAKTFLNDQGFHAWADVAGGILIGLGVIILVVALLEVLAGVFAWRGSDVARVLGILYGLFFGVGCLLGAVSSVRAETGANTTGGVVVLLVFAVAYLYTVAVFIFRWRGPA